MIFMVLGTVFTALVLACSSGCLTNQAIGEHPEWHKIVATPSDKGCDSELVHFPSTNGISLSAWWIPAAGGHHADVVLAHGQSGNRSDMLGRAASLVAAGYNVLAIDLRGHGESGGNYMTPGFKEAEDVLAAVAYLRRDDEHRRVILFGYSYGAVAVLHAAARNAEFAAVIADAAFISHTDSLYRAVAYVRSDPNASLGDKVGIRFLKWPGVLWLAGVEFYLRTGVKLNGEKIDAIDAVPRIKDIPVLFLAGELDAIAPACNAQHLLEATASPRKALVVLPGATHATFSDKSRTAYEDAVLEFLHGLPVTDAPTGQSGE